MSRKVINYEDILPQVPFTDTPIPKRIHQIFLGKPAHLLPEEIHKNIQYVKSLNPGWEYRLWSDEDVEPFILEHYNEDILRYFRMVSPEYRAAQADFLRYLIIYDMGGVYLDIKATMLKPLEETLLPSDRTSSIIGIMRKKAPIKGMGFIRIFPEIDFLMESSLKDS